ncbi:MAG: type I 3-dehydroquinate dehydratase [Chitinivibrionales bacterium]|nr:type I 3-dehydroquinate dehydratase [Chitinivibrionales bacterium]MBD3395249.1 type I 3-dehydroquinate dehydratase [Chitinivibrionales bacterium]
MAQAKIGKLALGKVPRVVAIIDEPLPVKRVERIVDMGADILEIRVDRFAADIDAVAGYVRTLKKSLSIPLLGTITENAQNSGTRLGMFEKIVPLVHAVDIDIHAGIRDEVVRMASGRTIVVSYHDFRKTPRAAEMGALVDQAIDCGADIVKIAVVARKTADVASLMQFTRSRSENLVTISMGAAGTISRVVAPLFGSLFTYAYTTKAVAPGQLSLEALVEEMRLFYPSFDEKFNRYA